MSRLEGRRNARKQPFVVKVVIRPVAASMEANVTVKENDTKSKYVQSLGPETHSAWVKVHARTFSRCVNDFGDRGPCEVVQSGLIPRPSAFFVTPRRDGEVIIVVVGYHQFYVL
jgi:hypothetical protein